MNSLHLQLHCQRFYVEEKIDNSYASYFVSIYSKLLWFCFQLLVLKYVQNKDVFMRYHKAHLTRRLILDTSADNEKEENMVEWLRVSDHVQNRERPEFNDVQ